jgi:hypothetical protein
MSDDRDQAAPASLEPPSLFRRKRRPRPEAELAPDAEPVAAADEQPTEIVDATPEPTAVITPVPEPVPAPAPAAESVPPAEPAPPLFADDVEPEPAVPPKEPKASKAPRGPVAPPLTGLAAAIVTGLLVGVLVVLLTGGGLQVCEAAQGTSTCGRAGYPMVLAIFVIAVVAGGALLRWSRVPDPTSTSFLAVGLLTVIALLFLVDQLDSWWMLGVIPAVSVATYALSHWVTTAVIEPARE